MKQKSPPKWISKIDKKGFEYLTATRLAKRAAKEIADPEKAQHFIMEALPRVFPGFRQTRSVTIKPETLEKMAEVGLHWENIQPGEHNLPPNFARIFENYDLILGAINSPELQKAFPMAAAFGLMFLQDIFSDIALHKFGTTDDLSIDQILWASGATLEWIAKMLKDRKAIPLYQEKGRANVERLELIRTIRAHQTKKLTPKEMKQALEYAGYHVSDEEALRLFEWRAKKKGQL